MIGKERDNVKVIEIKRLLFMLNAFTNRFDNKVLSKVGLSVQQAKIIFFLGGSKREEIYQKDIDVCLGITHSTSSGILSRLMDKGLVDYYISKLDKRCKALALTERGKELFSYIATEHSIAERKMVNGIPKKELSLFSSILLKMTQNMQD